MSAFELSEIVLHHGIKSHLELLVLAEEQKREGKTDIAEFIINRGPQVVARVLDSAWEIKNSKETLERRNKTRLELLNEAKAGDCVEGCNGLWLVCALELLNNNGIEIGKF